MKIAEALVEGLKKSGWKFRVRHISKGADEFVRNEPSGRPSCVKAFVKDDGSLLFGGPLEIATPAGERVATQYLELGFTK